MIIAPLSLSLSLSLCVCVCACVSLFLSELNEEARNEKREWELRFRSETSGHAWRYSQQDRDTGNPETQLEDASFYSCI